MPEADAQNPKPPWEPPPTPPDTISLAKRIEQLERPKEVPPPQAPLRAVDQLAIRMDKLEREWLEFRVPTWSRPRITGGRIAPVDPITDTRALAVNFFNEAYLNIPKGIMRDARADLQTVSVAEIAQAHKAGPLAHMQLVCEDTTFRATSKAAVLALLPHIGTNALRYVAPAWVCRNYASLLCCVFCASVPISAVAKTLDFQGSHSYNEVWCFDDDGKLVALMIEPQTDELIPALDPAHHYTGEGLAIVGG